MYHLDILMIKQLRPLSLILSVRNVCHAFLNCISLARMVLKKFQKSSTQKDYKPDLAEKYSKVIFSEFSHVFSTPDSWNVKENIITENINPSFQRTPMTRLKMSCTDVLILDRSDYS